MEVSLNKNEKSDKIDAAALIQKLRITDCESLTLYLKKIYKVPYLLILF